MTDELSLIPLTERETSILIRAAVGRTLPMAFGSGGAALIARQAPWALQRLLDLRGVTVQDGGGI